MKWLVAGVITAVCLAGCKSSQTSFNTLAPFGASRVPPPSTNSLNASGPYYNRSATPQTATPTMPGSTTAPAATQGAGSASGRMTSSASGTEGAWQPTAKTANAGGTTKTSATSSGASTVQPASYQAGTDSTKNASSSASSAGSSLRLNGMQVNDATTSGAGAEPARFVPAGSPVEIAQLPSLAPVTAPTSGTVVASAQASDQPAPASASAPSTLQWKSRP